MRLTEKAQQCQLLRQQIEDLTTTELYSVEQLSTLSQQLNTMLSEPISPTDDAAEYAAFLQLNLDWLQALMAKLSTEKDTVAASMLKIQQGRRARHSYGQHN